MVVVNENAILRMVDLEDDTIFYEIEPVDDPERLFARLEEELQELKQKDERTKE